MAAKLTIEVVSPNRTGLELWRSRVNFPSKAGIQQLERFFGELASAQAANVVRVTIDDSTGVAASNTVAFTYASLSAGDVVIIIGPTGQAFPFTCQTGAVTLGDATFRKVTDAAATGTSFAAQVNAFPGLQGVLTAAGTTTVTLTLTQKGALGNKWGLKKRVTTGAGTTLGGANFSGGKDAGQLQSVTATFSDKATANDTVIIGGVTFTCKASPANQSEFAPGADATATAANLTAKVNAHTDCKGLVLASSSLGVMTVQLQIAGRWGKLVTTGGVCSVLTWSATSFAASTTEAWAASLVTLNNGAVST